MFNIETGVITQYLYCANVKIAEWVIQTKDDSTIKALTALGWTPPQK